MANLVERTLVTLVDAETGNFAGFRGADGTIDQNMALVENGVLMGPDGAISVGSGAGNVVVMPGTPTFAYAGKTSSFTITVPAVGADEYDFIDDILPGMNFVGSGGAVHAGVVASVLGRVVTMTEADSVIAGYAMFGRDWEFTVPDGVEVVYASFCGGGGGGAGGSSSGTGGTNGGGGGGGASASYVDLPLYVTPGEVLSVCVGSGALGGNMGSPGSGNGGVTGIFAIGTVVAGLVASGASANDIRTDPATYIPKTSKGQIIPVATASNAATTRATAGGAAISGKGGDGGVLVSGVVAVAGGAASASNANHGAPALFKGAFGTTGGSGSSGTAASGTTGEGGSDGLHTDHSATTGANIGGSGGSSQFGKGGNVGNGTVGGYGRGYGAGGGGGGAGFAGGKGAPGIVIFRY